MPETHTDHFLKSVTQLGDRQAVTNHRDITNRDGVKLVARGSQITSALYGKLVKHKLLPPLEQTLSTENSVSHTSLERDLEAQLNGSNSPFSPIIDELPTAWRSQIIQQVPLPPPIAFKITVAREERPELYQHSITITLLALYLCQRMDWSEEETVAAASAALLHDIGILHINPKLFEHSHTMTLGERRHLYAHPLISHLIVTSMEAYPKAVSDGILQHHERLDGTGYPNGLRGESIGKIGQLLGVAELLGSRFGGNNGCADCAQLDLILKLNAQRMNAEYSLQLKPFYQLGEKKVKGNISIDNCRNNIFTLSTLFADWRSLSSIHKPVDREEQEQVELIDQEMRHLQKNLLQTGLVFDERPQKGSDTSWLTDDPDHLEEVSFLIKEAKWQLGDLYHLLHRRWPHLNPSGALHNWIERLNRVTAT